MISVNTNKSKAHPRWVANGQLCFAGRKFSPPELAVHSGSTVFVHFDSFLDAHFDIRTEDGALIATCKNRKEAA